MAEFKFKTFPEKHTTPTTGLPWRQNMRMLHMIMLVISDERRLHTAPREDHTRAASVVGLRLSRFEIFRGEHCSMHFMKYS